MMNLLHLLLLLSSQTAIAFIHQSSKRLASPQRSLTTSLQLDLISEFPISTTIASIVGFYGLVSVASYTKMQYVTASMISGVPSNSKVVEIDVQDGRNIFYLSNNCDYTAVMSLGNDPKKETEKLNFNERVVLESIGKANINNLNLKGKVRSRTQDIPSRSADCVLSLSGLCRAGDTAPETLQEVFRILRPGGLFVFVEPDTVRGQGQSVKELIKKVFPEKIKVQSSPIRNIDTASTSTSLSEDEEFIRSRGKRGATKNKFSKVNSAVIDKAEVSVATVADSIDNNNSNNKLSKTNDDQAAPGIQDTSTITATPDNNLKPGLVVEIHNNLINTYVSGIAVRPY